MRANTSSLLEKSQKPDALSGGKLAELYRAIIKPRLIEEKMLLLLRHGKISKWFSGIGQEAIAVGSTMALHDDEYILPLHRNLGVFTARGMPLKKLFCQFQGTEEGFTKGRDRSFHFGANEYHIVGMISHLGPQMVVADGIALAHKLNGDKKLSLVYCGDGGTSEGDFHEAINVAAVWDLPVIFLIENNGYGLSTPVSEQFRCGQLSDRAIGYGIEGVTIDGNDLSEVYVTISTLAESIRENPRPVIVECMTFRMRGHEEASGVKYVPKELFEEWQKKDPVNNFEKYLLEKKVLSRDEVQAVREEIGAEIDEAVEAAFSEKPVVPDSQRELGDVYAPYVQKEAEPSAATPVSKKRFVDAVSDGLKTALQRDERLIVMGQDIAEYGGVFKVTEGFSAKFGKERIRNTPICESAIVGAALGLSIMGYRSVVEMQFADFVSCGFNQIVNNLAKIHYRWGQNAGVVVRMPCGAGVAAGPFHSQSNEAWFFHTPGLKVVYPAFPYDAKGLLLASVEDPNPVIYFEHKALYRSIDQEIPDDYYLVPLGKAALRQEGDDFTIVTYGAGVHWALNFLKSAPDLSADLIDLRTLVPLDTEAIYTSVEKTGRVLVLHEDTLTGGIGGEISALITENCFEFLDAPVMRCASLDTPVPFAAPLEQNFLAKSRLAAAIDRLLKF